MDLKVGDVIKMKKSHPCGTNAWELRRVGMDIRIRCTGCGHQVMLLRKPGRKGVPRIRVPEWPISRKKVVAEVVKFCYNRKM